MSIERLPDLNYRQFGEWFYRRGHIWQMNLLSVSQLAHFVKDRKIRFSEKDITRLWQLGVLRADLVTSTQPLQQLGLDYLGKDDRGRYTYADVSALSVQEN